jgi:AAA family ATP:ADP antiporter
MPEPSRPAGAFGRRAQGLLPLLAMMGLFFLVVCSVGILRPIKNALALDGLGDTDFYKVYLVSAVVVLFVPLYNRLADRFPWRWLIPGVAVFFALNLVAFRFAYREGSAAFGVIFYGWYDLFAAALVTQFFMATQLFFNARTAKNAYPVVIAGGSIGATLGGAITGFFAERVGTPNLLLVAAALILVFSLGMPLVWRAGEAAAEAGGRKRRARQKLSAGEMGALLKDRHIRLIASLVLITVLAKQLVDYQFNTVSKEVFQDLDAISAFQGKFNAATQWLPLVALAALQPALRRYGMAAAVLLLPAAMLLTNVGLAVFWGLWAAVAAKGAETSLRYSAERAGREILYVPVAEDVKLRAKAYIDVAVEKGIGKAGSTVLIFVLLQFMDYRQTAWVGLALCVLWFAVALRARREYVRTLARSIEGRFASLRGVMASLLDGTTLPVVRQALTTGDSLRTAFVLDLVAQAPSEQARPLVPELRALLAHESAEMRARALELVARVAHPEDAAWIRPALVDESPEVREAAVRAVFAAHRKDSGVVEELLSGNDPRIRTAVLACVARGELGQEAFAVARRIYAARQGAEAAGVEARVELALAAGAVGDGDALALLSPFLSDPDPRVAATAFRSAALLDRPELYPSLLAGLARPATREAARDAFAALGPRVVPFLGERLLDGSERLVVRRAIPSVLAHIPSAVTVETLVRSLLAAETDQLLDYRTMKALSALRARHPELHIDPTLVGEPIAREAGAAARYAEAWSALPADSNGVTALLRTALLESWRERRETTFRALGLVHPPEETHRCFLAITSAEPRAHANALEWLETRTGRATFRQLGAVLEEPIAAERPVVNGRMLERLANDDDPWIALLVQRAHGVQRAHAPDPAETDVMDTIEKVFLLQNVDLLQGARSGHLATLATIAEEVDAPAGTALLRQGEPADALYVVVRGAVELKGVGGSLTAEEGAAFGTWALIDHAPSVVEARATASTRLLRISREDFHDLVGDHPELAIGLLQGLARRVRKVVA